MYVSFHSCVSLQEVYTMYKHRVNNLNIIIVMILWLGIESHLW